jgi:hypothetical protein
MTQAFNLSQFANFVNSSGQVSASGLQSGIVLPSGTTSLFYQSSAPTGWTQVTTLNDYALKLVSGTGGTYGGTTAFSTVFANQTPTISTAGLSAGATTLSIAQMPSHTHSINLVVSAQGLNCNTNGGSIGCGITGSQGGGGSHTHSISGSVTSSAITLNVRYANIIICSKN